MLNSELGPSCDQKYLYSHYFRSRYPPQNIHVPVRHSWLQVFLAFGSRNMHPVDFILQTAYKTFSKCGWISRPSQWHTRNCWWIHQTFSRKSPDILCKGAIFSFVTGQYFLLEESRLPWHLPLNRIHPSDLEVQASFSEFHVLPLTVTHSALYQ